MREKQKELVCQSMRKMAGDFRNRAISEEKYLEKVRLLEQHLETVEQGFSLFLESVRRYARENPGPVESRLRLYDEEAGQKLGSLHQLFLGAFRCMRDFPGSASETCLEEALSAAGSAMDIAADLDELSGDAGSFIDAERH